MNAAQARFHLHTLFRPELEDAPRRTEILASIEALAQAIAQQPDTPALTHLLDQEGDTAGATTTPAAPAGATTTEAPANRANAATSVPQPGHPSWRGTP